MSIPIAIPIGNRGRLVLAAGWVQGPRPRCTPLTHFGQPLRVEVYNEAGREWVGIADCSECGSTVHIEKFHSPKVAA